MSEPRRNEIALVALLDAVKAGQIRLYRNLFEQPRAFCNHPAYPSIDRPLYSPDFRAWCMDFIYVERRLFVSRRVIDPILDLLAARSQRNRVATATESELLEVLQKEPVAAAVVEFMDAKKTPQEFTMEGLWKELRTFADERGLYRNGRLRFPAGANAFSRKLNVLTDVLAHFGIGIEIRRSNGSKVLLTKRLDDSATQSSARSSAENSSSGDDLDAVDDRRRRLAALEDRRRRTTNL